MFPFFLVLWFENVKKCIGVSGDHGLNNVVAIVSECNMWHFNEKFIMILHSLIDF